MPASEIKLPLMCKAQHLSPVPHTPAGVRYAVCWGAGIHAPERSLGYLVELTGKRTGRVIAWLRDGGYAYACAGYLAVPPAEGPQIRLALWDNKRDAGCVRLVAPDGSLRQVSEFRVSGAGYTFVDPVCDLGAAYAGAPLSYAAFLAVCYLAFVHLPRLLGTQDQVGRTMGDVLDDLLGVPPADAVDALIAEVTDGRRTSGFERYAARVLTDADPAGFRHVAVRHEMTLRRLGSTGLFWIACALGEFTDDEAALLVGMEGALNRLVLIARAAQTEGFDALALSSEGRCADEDWRLLRSITNQGARLLGEAGQDNPLRSVRGVQAQRGGEWDVRTRLATRLEGLVLPYRLVYRFAVNAREGSVCVVCWVPPVAAMPRWRRGDAGAPELVSCAAQQGAAASAYALRLAALLFAAAFGAGAGVLQVRVRLTADRSLTVPVLDAQLDRSSFVTKIHERLRDGSFSDAATTWAPPYLADLLAPAQPTFTLSDALELAPLADEQGIFNPEPVRSCPLYQDERPLPEDLATLLHADRVRELDVFHAGDDPFADSVQRAADLSRTDPAEAARQLDDLLSVMEMAETMGGDGDGASTTKSLYCASNFARLAMALVESDPAVRYRAVPDSAFEARVLLARLCIDNNDAAHGATYAEQAMALGPTSARAHVEAAAAYIELGQPERAVAVLKQALATDAVPSSYTYTYYRLAYALWRAGDTDTALAAYVRALPNPTMHRAAQEELYALMAQCGISAVPDGDEVAAALARAGVPDAPTDAMVDLALRVMVRACDAGLLNVAALYAHLAGRVLGNDAVSAALVSLAPWGSAA